MSSPLTGVFPVLPTPFAPDGTPDTAALCRLVDFAVAAGANGVVFPGMASEVETLTPDERASLVAAVGCHLAGRLPFIVGASDADPARAAARATEGAATGAAAAMVMAPRHAGTDAAGHVTWFTALAERCPLPVMLQNAPPPNGAGLDPEVIAEVARAVPSVRFVKEETMPCGQHVTRLRHLCDGHVDAVFGGAGARYVMDELARGAAGTMPALELADMHARLWQAWSAGDAATARRLYTHSLPLLVFQAVFRVRATKAVLHRRGLIPGTDARAAGPVLDDGDMAELRALLAEADAAGLFLDHRPHLAP